LFAEEIVIQVGADGLNVATNEQRNYRACTYLFTASSISVTHIYILCSESIADPVETKNVYIEVDLYTISWDSK
jgi:hypothetical protein